MHEALFEEHDGLALHWARRHQRSEVDLDDLIQDARVGLILAAQRFDPDRKIRFSTYATYWIRNALQRGTINQIGSLSASEEARTRARAASRPEDGTSQAGIDPDANPRSTLSRVGQILASIEPGGEELSHRALASADPGPDEVVEERLERAEVRRAIDALPREQATLIQLRYGFLGASADRDEVLAITSIPHKAQRTLEGEALRSLRASLAEV